jgi:putative tryptophan/tyrosine transport system substrate-binding protein
MKRRELLLLLGGVMTAARALHAQQKAMPVIGFLGSPTPGSATAFVAAFLQGLEEMGYIEGQNVAVEYRWAEGRFEQLPELAAYLVGRKVEVIAADAVPSARPAKGATTRGYGGVAEALIPSRARRAPTCRAADAQRPFSNSG